MPRSGKSQRQKVFDLLACREWVSLPEILDLRVSQYSARIFELRRLGCEILNRTEWRDGQLCSWFRLVSAPVSLPNPSEKKPVASEPQSVLFDIGKDRTYQE